mmetsp:Transcript_48723/g.122988  ORF Transcript_48723/g.122988 Transcript_48723/m.122988 type:complete len:239 (-) Transcript_48723:501-1217(-)
MTTGGVGMTKAILRTEGTRTLTDRIAKYTTIPQSSPKPYLTRSKAPNRWMYFFCIKSLGSKNNPRPKIVMVAVQLALFVITLCTTVGKVLTWISRIRSSKPTRKPMVTGFLQTFQAIPASNLPIPEAAPSREAADVFRLVHWEVRRCASNSAGCTEQGESSTSHGRVCGTPAVAGVATSGLEGTSHEWRLNSSSAPGKLLEERRAVSLKWSARSARSSSVALRRRWEACVEHCWPAGA